MEYGALNCNSGLGTMTVNGVALSTSAWCAYDLTAMLEESDLRGGDRLVPHTVGVIANRRRRTVTRKDFPMIITGLFTSAGVRQTDTGQGLITNIEALKAGLGIGEDAPAGTAGTVTAIWTRPDATTKTAAVHVMGLRVTMPKVKPMIAQAVLSLSIPLARFT